MRTTWTQSVLLLSLAASGCGEPSDAFGPAQARALLPRAASMDPRTLDEIVRLGAMVEKEDLERIGNTSLSVAVIFFGPEFGVYFQEPDLVFDHAERVTPESLAPVWRPQVGDGGKRRPKYDFASVILDEYIQEVTCTRSGDAAQGTVSFAAPGVYRGKVEWKAKRDGHAWRIVEFRLPIARFRVFLEGDRWKAEDEARPGRPAGWISRQQAAVPTEDLVRLGTVTETPAEAWEVALDEDGSVYAHRGDGTFAAFTDLVALLAGLPGTQDPDGTSRRSIVLRVHPRLPWEVVLWVMQALAAPPMKAYRIHFAVRPEQGETEGCLAAWLPRDRGLVVTTARGKRSQNVRVWLFPDESEVDPGAALQAMQRTFAQAGAKAHATIVAPPAGRVAAGHVLRAIDLLYRAGFESVQFQGQGAPQPLLGPESAKGDWLREYVKKNPPMKPGYSLKVGNVHVVGQAGATPVPLPPAPPRRSATPAEGATPNEVVPAGEESAAAGTPTAGPAEDPVKVDVGSEMPSESPVPARRRGAFGGRRDALAQGPGPGGQSKKDPAVLHALRWLALHQSENGGWEAAGFDRWCEGKLSEVDRPDGQGDRDYDVGVTGLALGAFLGAGYTNRGDHEFAKVVRKGLAYLKGVQDKDGCYGRRPSPHFVYNHAAAALAMVEAYGMTESPVFRGSAQKAVEFLMAARNPRRAWRYGVKPGDDDTSVTGWMTMVLQSARLINTELARAGKPLVFPKDDEAFAGVQAWLDAVTDPATGRVGYLARGTGPSRETSRVAAFPPEKSEATTAIGLLARVFLSEDAASSDTVKKGLDLCANLPPTWDTAAGTIDLCYWYFGTMAVFQLGGEPWSRWERALDTALIPAQRMDGNYCGFKGSWDPIDAWGPDGGRVYSTSMACMCLEVIHRYDRLAAKDR